MVLSIVLTCASNALLFNPLFAIGGGGGGSSSSFFHSPAFNVRQFSLPYVAADVVALFVHSEFTILEA